MRLCRSICGPQIHARQLAALHYDAPIDDRQPRAAWSAGDQRSYWIRQRTCVLEIVDTERDDVCGFAGLEAADVVAAKGGGATARRQLERLPRRERICRWFCNPLQQHLPKSTARGNQAELAFAVVERGDFVVAHFGPLRVTEDAGVDRWKARHVEKILDDARPARLDNVGSADHFAQRRIVVLGKRWRTAILPRAHADRRSPEDQVLLQQARSEKLAGQELRRRSDRMPVAQQNGVRSAHAAAA